MNKRLSLLIWASAALLLAACTGTTATDSPATQAPATADSGSSDPGYPAPDYFEPPYPVEDPSGEIFEQNLTPIAPEPDFSTETGAMTVLLYYPDSERPVRGQLLFAAGMLPVQGVDGGFIPALDAENDASGHTDAQGVLVISNIQPGQYSLTLMTPLGPILVEDLESGEPVVFEITANQLTDLGELVVFLDPETLEP